MFVRLLTTHWALKKSRKRRRRKKKHANRDKDSNPFATSSSFSSPPPPSTFLSSSLPSDPRSLGGAIGEAELGSVQGEPLFGHIFTLVFLASVDFSLILPSLLPLVHHLGGGLTWYCAVFASYSAAQFLSSLFVTYLYTNKPVKSLVVASTILIITGNAIYLAPATTANLWLLVFARVLSGLGGGSAVFAFSHVACHSPSTSRPNRVALLRMVEVVGGFVAPALGVVFAHFDFLFFENVNEFNVCALAMVVLSGCYLLFLLAEALLSSRPGWPVVALFNRSMDEENETEQQLEEFNRFYAAISDERRVSWRCAMLAVLFALVAAFWAFLSSFLPYASDDSWSLVSHYMLFFFVSAMCVLSFVAIRVARLELHSWRLLTAALVSMAAGAICLIDLTPGSPDLPDFQLYLASGFLSVGFAVATVQVPAMYARLAALELSSWSMGGFSSFFAIASLAKVAGPIWGTLAYDAIGMNLIAFTICAVVLACLLLVMGQLSTGRSDYMSSVAPSDSLAFDANQPGYTSPNQSLLSSSSGHARYQTVSSSSASASSFV